jgi:membrane associated rhomboid family serine protease
VDTPGTAAPETTGVAPTCYRHPDRETYVRCTRCDRPICPDCMNDAAVGFQCPECVKQGARTVRQARTVFGGRVGADANVTKVLIAINVVAFVAQVVPRSTVTDDFGMWGAGLFLDGEYYRMITSAFLHDPGFLLHIAFNMYALLAFGSQVERLLGGVRYVVLYLVAALGASVATYVFFDPYGLSIGASGAVFGLFGAYFVMARKLRADTSQLVTLIGINLVIGFVGRGYINNYAHLGGLVTGAAVAYVYTRVPRGRSQAVLQIGGALLIAVLLCVVTAVKTADLRHNPPPAPREDTTDNALTTSWTGAPSR